MPLPRISLLPAALLLSWSLHSHADESDIPMAATVNDQPISVIEIDVQTRQFQARGQQATQEQVTQELISLEIMRQEAVKRGLDQSPEMAAEMKIMEARVLANALLTEFTEGLDLSDEVLRTEYEKQIAMADAKEFSASHILVEDEAKAIEIIGELDGGADFAESAKKYSTGPSGPNGGDLGWFDAGTMVPEFSAAVAAMEPGQHSAAPVQTQFGYHVIKLNDTRSKEAAPFDSVKDQIRGMMMNNRVQEFIEGLRSGATIEIK
ncbi:MAG: peptidylprolyl isomerase [Pseudomonadota bacterium]